MYNYYNEKWPEAKLHQYVNQHIVENSEEGFSDESVQGEDDVDDHKHVSDTFDIPSDEPINIFPEYKNPIQPFPIRLSHSRLGQRCIYFRILLLVTSVLLMTISLYICLLLIPLILLLVIWNGGSWQM
jgi:hypothetical protein